MLSDFRTLTFKHVRNTCSSEHASILRVVLIKKFYKESKCRNKRNGYKCQFMFYLYDIGTGNVFV